MRLLYLNIVYAIVQNDIYKLVAGVITLSRYPVQLLQNILFYAHRDYLVSVLAAFFNDLRLLTHKNTSQSM